MAAAVRLPLLLVGLAVAAMHAGTVARNVVGTVVAAGASGTSSVAFFAEVLDQFATVPMSCLPCSLLATLPNFPLS